MENIQKKILEFDPTNAPVEQVRQWLYLIIESEMEKPEDKIDYELIRACSDCDEMLLAGTDISNEEYQKGLESILVRTTNTETDKSVPKTVVFPPVKKKKRIRILALAATLTLLLGLVALTVVAKANGNQSILDYLGDLFKKEPGSTVDIGGVTVVKAHGSAFYSSIDEWMKAEGLDLLYPSSLPNDARIEQVVEADNGDGKMLYTVQMSTQNIRIYICNYTRVFVENWTDYTEYQTEYMTFAVQKADDINIAVGVYENHEYAITANNYNDLIYILDHLKGQIQ